jgi:hypothetical protein
MGHDSLLIQVDPEELEKFAYYFIGVTKKIIFKCGNIEEFNIPWEASSGATWGTLKKLKGN